MIKESLIFIAESDDKDKRLDAFLQEEMDEFTRSHIQKFIDGGNVLIEGVNKIKNGYKLKGKETITVNIPADEELKIEAEDIPLDIVYQDSDIVVINKAAGVCVHPAPGHHSGTLVNGILYHIKDLSGINGVTRPGIVHRLDMDTSGLIVVAKHDVAHTKMAEMFQNKGVTKTYIALLKGALNKKRGRIETLIGRDPSERKRMAVVDKNGKMAITNVDVVAVKGNHTFVKVNIETGRTHQIRVHMKAIGFPIDGDMVYGRGGIASRQMLHAYRLEFNHPITGEKLDFIGKISDDFIETMGKMEFDVEEMIKKL